MDLSDGQDPPLLRWQDLAHDFTPPISAMHVINARIGGGTNEELICDVQFDSIVKRGQEGLEGRLADRIRDAIVTTNALKAQGIDARVKLVRRRPLNVLENGRRRMEQELQVTMKR